MAYTTIDDPSVHIFRLLYTGTGATQSITNDGNSDLQPDWIWLNRLYKLAHLKMSTRGATKRIYPNHSE